MLGERGGGGAGQINSPCEIAERRAEPNSDHVGNGMIHTRAYGGERVTRE